VRNLCLAGDKKGLPNQKPFQGKVNYDYIMWIDSDNIFTVKQFKHLLNAMETQKEISVLAGIYLAEDQQRYLAHYLPDGKYSKKFKSEFVKPAHLKKLPQKPIPQVCMTITLSTGAVFALP